MNLTSLIEKELSGEGKIAKWPKGRLQDKFVRIYKIIMESGVSNPEVLSQSVARTLAMGWHAHQDNNKILENVSLVCKFHGRNLKPSPLSAAVFNILRKPVR